MADDYIRGQWCGFDRVLALLQTYEDRNINKAKLYHDIMELRPVVDWKTDPSYLIDEEPDEKENLRCLIQNLNQL